MSERKYEAGHPCPTGQHVGGRCCLACDHDYTGVECVCAEIGEEYVKHKAALRKSVADAEGK